jgi:hypothetical protein
MNEQKFFAWLDGELDPAEAAAISALVAADPALSAKAEAHRRMGARLSRAFAPVVQAPLPDALRSALRPPAEVVELANVRQRRRGLPSALQWGAMAATLVVGLISGMMVGNRPTASAPAVVFASASLGDALDTRLAGDLPGNGPRIGLTFRDRTGGYCRTFTASGTQGLACKQDGAWVVRALVPAGEGQTGAFRMAAGPDPALAASVDRLIVGEPFDAAQEKAARDAGWR